MKAPRSRRGWRRDRALHPGDRVAYDGAEHEVVGFTGTAVRLRSVFGAESVVLLAHLLAAEDFAVVDGAQMPHIEPFGLLEGLPEAVVQRARFWEKHLVEVMTGMPTPFEPGVVARAEYDPQSTTLAQRCAAKARELSAAGESVSARTVNRQRARYLEQGVWGLVDQRAVRRSNVTGRVDPRIVEVVTDVIQAQTVASTGTVTRVRRQAAAALAERYGRELSLPPERTFYRLVEALSVGKHTFGSAVTRRQTANRPAGVFTRTSAMRPGEQVQIDSTPLDVMCVFDDGVIGRPDLTIAVDVATRTICAAVLRPAGSKAVDASLMLARTLAPEPCGPAGPTHCA